MLSIAVMVFIHGLWRIDIRVPLQFVGDALLANTFIKNILNGDLLLRSDMLGAPFGTHFFDFPAFGFFDVLLIRIIGLFSGNWAVVINLFYFLTYPLTAVISVFAVKRMGINTNIAILIGVLFSIIPCHFIRNIGHLNLVGYYFIPFLALLLYISYVETDDFFHTVDGKQKINFRSKNFIQCMIMSVCLGLALLYYAFFSALVLCFAIAVVFGMERNLKAIKLMAVFIGIICVMVILSQMPTLVFIAVNGPNPDAVLRNDAEFNLYSLTISHLLMPIPGHVSVVMQRVRELFNADNSLMVNENLNSTLGTIGSIGFISSFFLLFWNLKALKNNKIIKLLSILVVLVLVTATFGGFGQIIFLFVRQIRAYNRISVVISFFSLAIVGFLLQELSIRLKNWMKHLMTAMLAVFLLIGIFDVSSSHLRTDQRETIKKMDSIGGFVSEIEAVMPHGSMVFQLPYIGNLPVFQHAHRIEYYAHFTPTLMSDNLRWSYGAPYGRPGDHWQRYVSSLNYDELPDILAFAGFGGVYIDTFGYIDDGEEIMSVFESILGSTPIVCNENRYFFYDIREHAGRISSGLTQAELEKEQARALQYVD